MLKRASAVIIKDKKILLVTANFKDYKKEFYWTPGGKVEAGESVKEALKREIKEELDAEIKSIKDYISYEGKNLVTSETTQVYCFLVNLADSKDNISPHNEITKIKWCSKEDFEKERVNILGGIKLHLIPSLIKDGLL